MIMLSSFDGLLLGEGVLWCSKRPVTILKWLWLMHKGSGGRGDLSRRSHRGDLLLLMDWLIKRLSMMQSSLHILNVEAWVTLVVSRLSVCVANFTSVEGLSVMLMLWLLKKEVVDQRLVVVLMHELDILMAIVVRIRGIKSTMDCVLMEVNWLNVGLMVVSMLEWRVVSFKFFSLQISVQVVRIALMVTHIVLCLMVLGVVHTVFVLAVVVVRHLVLHLLRLRLLGGLLLNRFGLLLLSGLCLGLWLLLRLRLLVRGLFMPWLLLMLLGRLDLLVLWLLLRRLLMLLWLLLLVLLLRFGL